MPGSAVFRQSFALSVPEDSGNASENTSHQVPITDGPPEYGPVVNDGAAETAYTTLRPDRAGPPTFTCPAPSPPVGVARARQICRRVNQMNDGLFTR
jgi:hypothetical protein